jgi:hypothetical protein
MGHAHAIEIGVDGEDRWLSAAADPRSQGQAQAW